jgi:hypothetical protein
LPHHNATPEPLFSYKGPDRRLDEQPC